MARKRNRSGLRDIVSIPRPRLPVRLNSIVPSFHLSPVSVFKQAKRAVVKLVTPPVEDRRRFRVPQTPVKTSVGRNARITVRDNNFQFLTDLVPISIAGGVRHTAPGKKGRVRDSVSVCSKRKTRREVIFAGGGGGKHFKRRHPRRNELSDVRC